VEGGYLKKLRIVSQGRKRRDKNIEKPRKKALKKRKKEGCSKKQKKIQKK